MVGLAAAEVSFPKASALLEGLAGVQVETKQVERTAEALGREIEADERHVTEPGSCPAPTMYLGLDGTGVPVRKSEVEGRRGKQPDGSAKTREVKLVAVWTAERRDAAGRPVRDRGSVSYNAAVESAASRDTDPRPSAFAQRVYREAQRRGFDASARRVVLGDGAPWIWNLAGEQFPGALEIVDLHHAKQHLSDVAKALCGVPVRLADRDPVLETLLGAVLHGLMAQEIRGAGAAAREALSVAARRAALRTHSLRAHSLRARARQVCAAALADPPEPARISVLLATRRPARLAAALVNVARQRYPRLELVLALHGPGFAADAVERAMAGFPHPVKLLRLDAGRPLGSVLNAAADAAGGALLAKMDDDDLYGPEHLWDVALAREYSGAELVGKFPATVYLTRGDRTVRRRRVPGETWSSSITGGAMLMGRADLERAGGWRRVARHVDAALVEDVLRGGGGVYRTHDAGYLMVRHGDRHTWEADDAEFLAGAEAVHAGWRPALAGIGDAPPPDGPDAGRGDA